MVTCRPPPQRRQPYFYALGALPRAARALLEECGSKRADAAGHRDHQSALLAHLLGGFVCYEVGYDPSQRL